MMEASQSIEKLVDYYVSEDGSMYYLVKWKQTWERADSLQPFNSLVEKFWQFVNEKDKSNLFNNKVALQKPKPVLPKTLPPPVAINKAPPAVINPVHPSLQKTPQKKRSLSASNRGPTTPKTPKTAKIINQPPMQSPIQHQQHPLPPMQSPIQHQQQPPMQRIKSEPMLSNMPTQPMLIIDSDEDDNNVAPPNQNINNVNSNMNPNINTNMNQNIMDSFNSFRTSQLNNTTMLQGIKSEPNFGNNVFPTNQSPQQNQFQFNPHMNNNLTNMAVPPLGGRGRGAAGRGGNIMSPAKRKIGMPSAGDSPNNINQGYNIKMEDTNVKNETLSSPTSTSSLSWEENCELINTQTVDGVSLDVQYK